MEHQAYVHGQEDRDHYPEETREMNEGVKKYKRGDVREDGMIFYAQKKGVPIFMNPEQFTRTTEKDRIRLQKYYSANANKIQKRSREWVQVNKLQANASRLKWARENKLVRRKIQTESQQRCRVQKHAYRMNRLHSDPLFKAHYLVRNRMRSIVRSFGAKKDRRTWDILGCSKDYFKHHIEAQFYGGMTWEHFLKGLVHMDHRVPLASATTVEEVYALGHHSNIQPLWAHHNLEKSDRLDWKKPVDDKVA